MAVAMVASLAVVLVLGLWIPEPAGPAAARRGDRDRRPGVIAPQRSRARRATLSRSSSSAPAAG